MSGVRAEAAVRPGPRAGAGFIGRHERFALVASTNDIVRDWLADDEPEVCLAVADRQSAGRGRAGRTWLAPDGAALLLSLGFRPAWLPADRTWRLAALVAVAMAGAVEAVAALPAGSVRLKWPNDLVVEDGGPADPRRGRPRKLAGLLGETDGLGTDVPRVTIGIGLNVDWPAAAFPADLAAGMTSLHELVGRDVPDRDVLLAAFLARLEPSVTDLRAGRFAAAEWEDRQLTTGRIVRLVQADGTSGLVRALGVDADSGALLVADPASAVPRRVFSGEIQHLRLAASSGPPARRAGGSVVAGL